MEENIICMQMDVKLDIRERKIEFSHLKTWTKYIVKIEAIKCFPCYMKISFLKSLNDDHTDLVVRINIPGLTVQMATSRTKPHSYGLFWKNNRKRCCVYLALESQLICERHLRWIKKSIRNLELYRQEILQTRRASRALIRENGEGDDVSNNDLGIYQNLDKAQNFKDLNDILGPLPKIPDVSSDGNWSRRVSGYSGIYEEILDPNYHNKSRTSRASIASGIYEEMKLVESKKSVVINECDDSPPPLPPRTRSNTSEYELQRSFTNPETDYFKKKKHWALFETMFGRRRLNSCSSSKSSKAETQSTPKVVTRQKLSGFNLIKSKRNSFSSPDLSNLNIYGSTQLDDISYMGSCTSEFYVPVTEEYVSTDYLNTSSSSNSIVNLFLEETTPTKTINISQQIKPNYNISCNSSTINLVGSNLNALNRSNNETPPAATTTDDLAGYCEMGPIGFNKNKVKEMDVNNLMLLKQESRLDMDDDSSSVVYVNMRAKPKDEPESPKPAVNKNRNSIDEKIPSYYPNADYKTPQKSSEKTPPKKRTRRLTKVCKCNENYYITSPRNPHHITASERSPKKIATKVVSSSTPNVYSVNPSNDKLAISAITTTASTETTPSSNSTVESPQITPKLYQKYATLAKYTSNKYLEKSSAKKNDATQIQNSKRFASLPRFTKFDLSPLKLKINNVLQRNNLENLQRQ